MIRSLAFITVILLGACSDPAPQTSAPPPAPTVDTAQLITAMQNTLGGRAALEAVQLLVQQGGGTRRHFGQVSATGGEDPEGMLSNLTETIDLANARAAFDNVIQIGGGFSQHRTEAYTTYNGTHLGWGTTEGRVNHVTSVNGLFSWASHNTPEILLRRNAVTIALAASAAPGPVTERTLDGASYWYLDAPVGIETIGLYIDKTSSQLRAWSAIDTETMWGDTNAVYVLGDWREAGDVVLPHAIEIRKDDGVYADLRYDTITVNDDSALAIFDVPSDVTADADQVVAANGTSWVPLQWNAVAPGIAHVVAFSHHSMVVEFPNFVVVVEGPYTEGQSLTLARMINERIGKPIRYVVPSHPHFDHTGGIRGLASVGANVLVAGGHEAELRHIVESPHTNPPDALAENFAAGAEVGKVEVFNGMTDISDGDMSLQLFEVQGIPHVAPKVLAFVPSTGVLFQSDLFFGGPSPDAMALYEAITSRGLQVQQIVGGHGGVLPYQTLVDAVTP
jgi:glyoxylase-like metal-dependent hydrolase (beta-lactamase superfamily II)